MALPGKDDQLAALRGRIEADNVCPELKAQATQLVFGDGSADSSLVFIGEAPGKKEDETGIPFVGAAGKFLSEMLEMIGLDRKEVYITNIVKYRPPGNRDPLPEEKKAFLPYLQEQLEIIRPRIVVTLGRHASGCFLPELVISRDHGRAKLVSLNFSGNQLKVVLLPLFHPAAALYNGSMRQTLIDDFATIPKLIKLSEDNKLSQLINA